MSTQRKTQGSSDSTNQSVFADFEPPHTTDGSYRGTMAKIKATEDHLQRKFDEKLEEVKARLKASKCRVGITVRGSAIQLQATLPPKPGSHKVKPHQQLISLGIPASLDGLRTAEEEANELGKLLARRQFEWNEKYLGKKEEETKIPTIGDLLEKIEEEYFKTRKRTSLSENSLASHILCIKTMFPSDCLFNTPNIKKAIEDISLPTKKYVAYRKSVFLSNLFKIKLDLSELKIPQPKLKTKELPTDIEICTKIKYFENHAQQKKFKRSNQMDNWKFFYWTYGMLAVYGLRPRELFVNPNFEWWLNEENINNTWKVDESTKTGSREVIPFVPEWIKLFDLKNPIYITLVKQRIEKRNNWKGISQIVKVIGDWFNDLAIGFTPYDLRHACAVRAHMQGIPVKAVADNLGHTVEIHMRIYQKNFGLENRKKAINQAIMKKSEFDELKELVNNQKLEIERLRLENERLKLLH